MLMVEECLHNVDGTAQAYAEWMTQAKGKG